MLGGDSHMIWSVCIYFMQNPAEKKLYVWNNTCKTPYVS